MPLVAHQEGFVAARKQFPRWGSKKAAVLPDAMQSGSRAGVDSHHFRAFLVEGGSGRAERRAMPASRWVGRGGEVGVGLVGEGASGPAAQGNRNWAPMPASVLK